MTSKDDYEDDDFNLEEITEKLDSKSSASADKDTDDNSSDDEDNDDSSQEPTSEKTARSQSHRLREAIAHAGSPKMPRWDNAEQLNYNVTKNAETGEVENIVDYENLENINDTINSLRVALFKVTKAIDNNERKLRYAKVNYDREFRREYLMSTERTETRKKEFAALMSEQLEDKVIYLEQVNSEIKRRSTLLRDELGIMNTLSNNIRQQLK